MLIICKWRCDSSTLSWWRHRMLVSLLSENFSWNVYFISYRMIGILIFEMGTITKWQDYYGVVHLFIFIHIDRQQNQTHNKHDKNRWLRKTAKRNRELAMDWKMETSSSNQQYIHSHKNGIRTTPQFGLNNNNSKHIEPTILSLHFRYVSLTASRRNETTHPAMSIRNRPVNSFAPRRMSDSSFSAPQLEVEAVHLRRSEFKFIMSKWRRQWWTQHERLQHFCTNP